MRRILFIVFSFVFVFSGLAQNIPTKTHRSQSWKVHEIAKDFVLLDVWEFPILADKTRNQDFSSFLKIMRQPPKNSVAGFFSLRHLAARFLVSLRVYMGEIFGLDKNINSLPIPGCEETSMKERLSVEDLKKNIADSIGEGIQDKGIWQTVYLYENEMLTEHSNDTVHVLMHFGWVQKSGNYFTAQLAVYAKPRGKWGEFYMKLIMPFRHVIVYPAMMEEVKKNGMRTIKSKGGNDACHKSYKRSIFPPCTGIYPDRFCDFRPCRPVSLRKQDARHHDSGICQSFG